MGDTFVGILDNVNLAPGHSLLAYLRIGKSSTGETGKVLELSERGKLQKANLEVVLSYGTKLLEVLSRDATTGHEVRRMLAIAVLDDELSCCSKLASWRGWQSLVSSI